LGRFDRAVNREALRDDLGLLVDGHCLVCEALPNAFAREPDIKVVGCHYCVAPDLPLPPRQ
jgi:hypothetical protein